MTDEQVRELILNIIHDIAPDEDLSDVKPDVRLRDQLDLDSMDFLDIVMELRKRHKIEVPEEDYMQLATLDGCVTYLKPMLEARDVKA
jgi:acyl carrier protein